MIVVTQDREQILMFENFVFTAVEGKKGKGHIAASKDIVAPMKEVEHRFIATYENIDITKKVLKDMYTDYAIGVNVYLLPESEV